MTCPVCGSELQETQRGTVTIDVCPRCRGVWLDRGELEKILEMEASDLGQRRPLLRYDDDEHRGIRGREHHDHDDDQGHDYDDRYGRPRRRRGLLGGIFDAFDRD